MTAQIDATQKSASEDFDAKSSKVFVAMAERVKKDKRWYPRAMTEASMIDGKAALQPDAAEAAEKEWQQEKRGYKSDAAAASKALEECKKKLADSERRLAALEKAHEHDRLEWQKATSEMSTRGMQHEIAMARWHNERSDLQKTIVELQRQRRDLDTVLTAESH